MFFIILIGNLTHWLVFALVVDARDGIMCVVGTVEALNHMRFMGANTKRCANRKENRFAKLTNNKKKG